MYLRISNFLIIAALLCCSQRGWSQDAAITQLAKKHYELGSAFYSTSNYRKAIEHFEKSYELSPRPALLFNIARSYEPVDAQQAVIYYKRYLVEAGPDAPNRSLVQVRLSNLQEQAKQQRPRGGLPVSGDLQQEEGEGADGVENAEDSQPAPGSWKRTAGWITLGTGAAALAAGVILGSMASTKANEYEDGKELLTYRELEELKSSGEGLQSGQIAGLVVGSVLVAAGAGLLLWEKLGRRPSAASARRWIVATPIATDRHLGLCATGSF